MSDDFRPGPIMSAPRYNETILAERVLLTLIEAGFGQKMQSNEIVKMTRLIVDAFKKEFPQ